eukprot:g73816.t1
MGGPSSGAPRKPIRCIETGEVFPSVHGAALACEVDRRNLQKALRNRRLRAGGYHWCYAMPEGEYLDDFLELC